MLQRRRGSLIRFRVLRVQLRGPRYLIRYRRFGKVKATVACATSHTTKLVEELVQAATSTARLGILVGIVQPPPSDQV